MFIAHYTTTDTRHLLSLEYSVNLVRAGANVSTTKATWAGAIMSLFVDCALDVA